ncbi:MAG: ComEA family DNA-binding protein [Actinomycetaceae bacterium]|nr:ComEA family DNA-binding protein [Actinomycetaceae bacterium]
METGPEIPSQLKRLRRSLYAQADSGSRGAGVRASHRSSPARIQRWRWAPSLPAALGLGFMLLLLLVAVALRVLTPALGEAARPVAEENEPPAPQVTQGSDAQSPIPLVAGNAGDGSEAGNLAPTGDITVYLSGAVKRPGIVKLPAGGRLHEAIAACGGTNEDADPRLYNLAAILTDAEHIHIPAVGEDPPAGFAAGNTSTSNGQSYSGCIDVTTASAEQLESLDGIGPALAKRIIEARTAGEVKTASDLQQVSGIGVKKYAGIESKLCR